MHIRFRLGDLGIYVRVAKSQDNFYLLNMNFDSVECECECVYVYICPCLGTGKETE